MNALEAIQELGFISFYTTASSTAPEVAAATGDNSSEALAPAMTGPASEFLLKRLVRSLAFGGMAEGGELPDRHIGSFLSYLVSPFALLCMGMAIILNRTVVFATTRRPTSLSLPYRVLLRSIAIYSLATQTVTLLQALKCVSPDGLGRLVPESLAARDGECPSPPILWGLYRSICVGHFIETFSSVIQGHVPYSETGMTLFEYSVAFQEVQSSHKLSVEILVVAILSALSHLALHVQGVFNSYSYRLVMSALFGGTFLAYFAYSTYEGRLLFFPSVCVIGYLPQLAISMIVVVCGGIYGLACLFAGGPGNMQTSLASFNLDLSDDFYSCLMKLGMIALTSATKATYLTEVPALSAPLSTWIERLERDAAEKNRRLRPQVTPYKNEVVLSPVNTRLESSPQLQPFWFATLNRLFSAAQMVQALAVLCLYTAWRLAREAVVGVLQVFGVRADDQAADRQRRAESTIQALRSQVIYSSLNDQYSGHLKLLSGDLIPDIDDSEDYVPEAEDEEDYSDNEIGYEYESDYASSDEGLTTSYMSSAAIQRAAASSQPAPRSSLGEFYDLVMSSPDYLVSLLAPKTDEEAEEARILSSHLSSSRITRSRYRKLSERTHDDSIAVLDLIMERRRNPLPSGSAPQVREAVCVVCQSAPRQIVLWPCRCFALCEECRLGLAVKNFKGCVCCRRPVESFSKIFVP
ncbi:hypothetical protein TRVA0_020S00650 [Trichomonascus vanleenenianus]|uniref:uncharacterized protein n=1 Tax=Trichomonascus vanleenenianus TaxID=2268995 RepID=UPI003EC96E3E